jgi:hypothetical protein
MKRKSHKQNHTENKQNKNWFFEKINKIDKALANMTKQDGKDPN